jgi:hypothetical protein
MSNINDFFPSKWLKASDLKGREPVLVIQRVVGEEVGQRREVKPIVYFEKVQKGLVLNKTNAHRIMQIAGSNVVEDWKGVSIKLYATEVEFQGELTDAIRIKPVQASKLNTPRPAVRTEVTPGDAFEEAALEVARDVLGPDDDIPF